MFAFGGESRFLVYPVKYSGTLENESPVNFSSFFKNEPIEIDVIENMRNIPGCPEIGNTLLCRDFCLSIDGEFVILASSTPADRYEIEDKPPKTFLLQSGNRIRSVLNDSHTAFPCLDHVTFYLLSLKRMKVVDYIHFKYDFIYLAHHLGVGLQGNLFSVLSMKNQRIFVFNLEGGKFGELNEIARNSISSIEQVTISKIPEDAQVDDSWGRPGVNGFTLKLIKHLIYVYGIQQIPLPSSILSSLHIWKHQLLPNDKVLLRVVPATLILATNPRHQSMVHALDPLPSIHKNSYLVLMDLVSGDIEVVYNSADPELFEWIERNWIWLKGNSIETDSFETTVQNLKASLNTQSSCNSFIRRFSNFLPQSPQQLTESLFLDSRNFRWDPKITSVLSRSTPISCYYFMNTEKVKDFTGICDSNYGMEPVKFFSRLNPSKIAFKLRFVDENTFSNSSVTDTNSNNMDRHKWLNVLFHPTLPLIVVYQYGIFRSLSLRIFYM